jgi:nucleoside-diphosphate kinase
MLERSLVLIKPDGVKRHLIGEIVKRFEQNGLEIIALKMTQVDAAMASEHYFDLGERKGEQVKRRMVNFLVSGPVVAMVLEGEGAVAKIRQIIGTTEPASADKGTIRGDLATDSYEIADKEDRAVENLVHASGNLEEAATEVKLWFPEL